MSFCANCGSRLEEGTQFCGNCGTPVESASQEPVQSNMAGQPINNIPRPNPGPQQQYQQPYQQQVNPQPYQQPANPQPYQQPANPQPFQQQYQQPYHVAPSQVGIYFTQVFDTVKNIFIHPASSIVRVGKVLSDQASFILGGLLAIIYGLLNLWLFSAITTNLKNTTSRNFSVTDGFTGLMGEFNVAFKYPSKILFSILLYVLVILVIFVSIFIVGKALYKSQGNTFSIFKVVVAASIPYIIFLIVQILLTYLNIGIGLLFGILGLLISLLTLYKGVEYELQLDSNKSVFVIALSVIIAILISVVIVNAITTSSLKASLNIKNPDLNDLLKGYLQ